MRTFNDTSTGIGSLLPRDVAGLPEQMPGPIPAPVPQRPEGEFVPFIMTEEQYLGIMKYLSAMPHQFAAPLFKFFVDIENAAQDYKRIKMAEAEAQKEQAA